MIQMSDVKSIKLSGQDVKQIANLNGDILWKPNKPEDDFYILSNNEICTYSASSGAINALGINIPDFDGKSSLKVYWDMLFYSDFISSDDKFIFPYKKGSSSTAANSKIGIGSMRANASKEITSGSAVYGLTLEDGFDFSSYKSILFEYDKYYCGNFTVNPGSSSTYNKNCIGLIQLESLYAKDGSGLVTPYEIRLETLDDYLFYSNEFEDGYMEIKDERILSILLRLPDPDEVWKLGLVIRVMVKKV